MDRKAGIEKIMERRGSKHVRYFLKMLSLLFGDEVGDIYGQWVS